MDDRTKDYLEGRFSDYYRSVDVDKPPCGEDKELAVRPWYKDIMDRHHAIRDISNFSEHISGMSPKHVYVSAARFEHPEVEDMSEREWLGSDLVFDIDAKDVSSVNKTDSHEVQLKKSKEEFKRLVEIVEEDLGFDDYYIKFSGNQGFHLHVLDESIIDLRKRGRTQISDYVQANGITFKTLTMESNWYGSMSREFIPGGFWSEKFYDKILDTIDRAKNNRTSLKSELEGVEGVGEKTAESIISSLLENEDSIKMGLIKEDSKTEKLADHLIKDIMVNDGVDVDQPVTTDVNRLMRLADSLHGGSGLVVKEVENLDEFKPLDDAVPDLFSNDLDIVVQEDCEITRKGKTYTFEEGDKETVAEHVGISLMCEGKAKLR